MEIKLNENQKFCLVMILLMFVLTSPFIFSTYGNDITEYKGHYRYVVLGTVGLEEFVPCILLYAIFTIIILVYSAEGFWDGKNGKTKYGQ